MSRFDNVQYDELSNQHSVELKEAFVKLEELVGKAMKAPRAKALVFTKLEEAFMWVGKALRDDQLKRKPASEVPPPAPPAPPADQAPQPVTP